MALTAGADCAGVTPGDAVRHCYIITPTINSGRAATVTFFYRNDEVPAGLSCSQMEAYRWDGSWDNLLARDIAYGTEGRLCGSDPLSIQVRDVATFGPFVLQGQYKVYLPLVLRDY